MLYLDSSPLTLNQVHEVARHHHPVALAETARQRMIDGRAVVEKIVQEQRVTYGINTGFGSLSRVTIPPDDVRKMQRNLVRSHAAGVGAVLPSDIVRAMLVILAASLARGYSGVRVEIVETLIAMLNADVLPVVPSRGSVGASGDLAPLAHIASVLIGEGQAYYQGQLLSGEGALAWAGISPITLEAKEGLALINGTHLMSAMLALMVLDTRQLLHAAIGAAALSLDASRATDTFLDPRVHEIRRQYGQIYVAQHMRDLLQGSEIVLSHRENDPRVQDPYSLRCTPQVLGAAWDTLNHIEQIIERELGAVTDNPLVFADNGDIISGGNFHGMPLAIAIDTLKIAIAHIAGISERRVYHLLSAFDTESHLTPYLSPQPGLHSGLMIAQYTAAALCNEIQTLANPASVHNIPTSADMEDYNSMGVTAAHQAWQVLELARQVIAIELISSAEALDYHRPLKSGTGVEKIHDAVRSQVPRLTEDRSPAPDIQKVVALIIQEGVLSP